MKITRDEVAHVAGLAHLKLDEETIDSFARQLRDILGYIDTLNRADTEGVTPTSHAIFLTNAFRDDKMKKHLDREAVLANAPEKEDGNFVVSKVIG